MNIAVIIAGGVGQRMGHNLPKQFIKVYIGKLSASSADRCHRGCMH